MTMHLYCIISWEIHDYHNSQHFTNHIWLTEFPVPFIWNILFCFCLTHTIHHHIELYSVISICESVSHCHIEYPVLYMLHNFLLFWPAHTIHCHIEHTLTCVIIFKTYNTLSHRIQSCVYVTHTIHCHIISTFTCISNTYNGLSHRSHCNMCNTCKIWHQ